MSLIKKIVEKYGPKIDGYNGCPITGQELIRILEEIERERIKAIRKRTPDSALEYQAHFFSEKEEIEWKVGDCFESIEQKLMIIFDNESDHNKFRAVNSSGNVSGWYFNSPNAVAQSYPNSKRISKKEFLNDNLS